MKFVYSFNEDSKENSKERRALLGGKGAGLAEMTKIGLPVPFGFTITTEACKKYQEDGHVLDQAIVDEAFEHLAELEEVMGKQFGSTENPLLVSVRSGAPISMPGMMDTILNLGLNDISVEGLAAKTGNDRFAYDSYRRFIQMFGDVVMEIKKAKFDKIFNAILAFLTQALYGPEVTYKDESMKGRHRLPGPAIIVSNHTCHLDGGILNTVFRKQKIHTLAAKDRFEQKFFGFMLRHTYCIPIDRQNADTSWVHESVRILKEGKDCVAIYPEGRHGSHRQQLPFHQGVAMLAFFVDVPVVVVYQDGPHRLFHRSKVIVDAPMMLPKDGGLTPEALAANTELLQQRMKDLMKELTDGE